MRITNKSMNINLLRNLNQGLKRYDRLSEQLVSEEKCIVLPIVQLLSAILWI